MAKIITRSERSIFDISTLKMVLKNYMIIGLIRMSGKIWLKTLPIILIKQILKQFLPKTNEFWSEQSNYEVIPFFKEQKERDLKKDK